MGYTSKELDEDITLADQQLLLTLEGPKQEYDMQKMAASVAMAFGGSKKTDVSGEVKKDARRRTRIVSK
jgi:hypothetical protein